MEKQSGDVVSTLGTGVQIVLPLPFQIGNLASACVPLLPAMAQFYPGHCEVQALGGD